MQDHPQPTEFIELASGAKVFEILPNNQRTNLVLKQRAETAEQEAIKAEERRQQ